MMVEVAAEANAPVIIMHMKGTPRDMQKRPAYKDVVKEIIDFFKERISYAIKNGIKKNKIIIDPGIGFGKTVRHNLEIIKRLGEFKRLGVPILLGPSRKSFIGRMDATPEKRMEGTAAVVAIGIVNGANIVRVHDVKAMADVAKATDAIMRGESVDSFFDVIKTIRIWDIIDILIVAFVIYRIFLIIKGTRACKCLSDLPSFLRPLLHPDGLSFIQ